MKMTFEILLSVLLIALNHLQHGDGQTLSIKDFLSDSNVTDYADHTQAFQNAWNVLCQGKAESLVVHASETYTIRPSLFKGPCVPRKLLIQIDGTIEAPIAVKDWGAKSECWLCFDQVTGLVLTGSGKLNAHGESWWYSVAFSARPTALRFLKCRFFLYNGLTQTNSPRNHISVVDSAYATLSNLNIIAPKDSPNTDGIDIDRSHDIRISESSIKTGDDCIAINTGSLDINITSVGCGPGHGISIGSLGKDGAFNTVENVNVRHCNFEGTESCARIKTWKGGQGYAKQIVFEDITVVNSLFPIIIDQHYNPDNYNVAQMDSAVKVSDVTFKSFRGTCLDGAVIRLDCDKTVGCDNIILEDINVTSSSPKVTATAFCRFAHVISRLVSIPITCGSSEELILAPQAQPPAPAAQPLSLFSFLDMF